MLAFGLDLNQRYGPDAITPDRCGRRRQRGLKLLCARWVADPPGNLALNKLAL